MKLDFDPLLITHLEMLSASTGLTINHIVSQLVSIDLCVHSSATDLEKATMLAIVERCAERRNT